jgi:rubrerythrin
MNGMARGWESKAVEAQQAEAGDKSSQPRPKISAEQAAALREKERWRLSRQRVLQQLEASTNPRHRKLLQETLADLDEKLRELQEQSIGPKYNDFL